MANSNGLTDSQVKAGYSTIPGNFNPVTGQPNNPSGGGSTTATASIPTNQLSFSSNPGNGSGFFGTPTTNSVQTPSTINVSSPYQVPYKAPSANNSVSGTTLSNTNKINQVQQNNQALDQVSQKGITADANGSATYANGTQAKTVANTVQNPDGSSTVTYADGTTSQSSPKVPAQATTATQGGNQPSPYMTTDASSEDASTNAILDHLMATTDANTATQIQSIQNQYAIREQQQQQLNQQASQRVQSALLMGGANGAGSSSQFAPISSSGIIQAQESYGIQQLAALDAEENAQIAAARQAQYSNNFQVMGKKLDAINAARTEKYNLTAKLNDQAIAQNKKLADDIYQSKIDNSIADVYSQGITDVAGIVTKLQSQGIQITAEQAANAIKSIVPPGLDDLVKTMQANNAPAETIAKVLQAKNLAEAFKIAGPYSAGGTGDVAEYNMYRAQALAKGQVPLDYLGFIGAKKAAETATATGTIGGFATGNGVINGYDISTYATDPNHEKAVTNIYNDISPITDVNTAQSAISQLSASSPITGEMVINSASKYGVDPKLIVAMMQQDSSLGTAGKGAKTFNPGNVGNDDAGNIKNYGSWEKGVDAVAQWLSNHSVTKKFANTVDSVANMENTVSGKKDVKAQMNSLISSGDYASAYQQVANSIEGKLTGTSKTTFADARTDYEIIGGLQDAVQQYADAGGDMGLLTGTEEQIKRKLGIDNGKATVLATQLWREFQSYRQQMTGAAFTPAESADYASVNPTLGKSLDLNLSVIQGAKNQLSNRIDSTIDARVPHASELRKLADSNTQDFGGSLVDTEEGAKAKVDQIYKTANDATASAIENLISKNFTNMEIYEYLQSHGQLSQTPDSQPAQASSGNYDPSAAFNNIKTNAKSPLSSFLKK